VLAAGYLVRVDLLRSSLALLLREDHRFLIESTRSTVRGKLLAVQNSIGLPRSVVCISHLAVISILPERSTSLGLLAGGVTHPLHEALLDLREALVSEGRQFRPRRLTIVPTEGGLVGVLIVVSYHVLG